MWSRHSFGRTSLVLRIACLLALAAAGPAAAAERFGEDCAVCHEETVGAFSRNIHSKTTFYGRPASCESCHRGAKVHAESGDVALVVNPRKASIDEASEICLQCHSSGKSQMFWKGSAHQRHEVGCTGCHGVHGGRARLLITAEQNSLCFSCHLTVRSDVLKRSRHPLRDPSFAAREGKMACSDCHNPHGARSKTLIDARSVNDKCYECHAEKRAPVLWEHSPVKEDCLACHTAHGSSNDKLLTTRVPRLCQECHMQGRHQSAPLTTNSVFAFNRSCLNCHPQVHGSNNPSGAILQR